jgi:hypothetical protein
MDMANYINKNNNNYLFMKDSGIKIIFMEKERLLITNVSIVKALLIIKTLMRLNSIGALTMV